jgi:ribosome modulation factor
MNQQQYEQARLAGYRARQAGKKRDDSPKYGMGEDGYLLREAWRNGFDEADAERRKVA